MAERALRGVHHSSASNVGLGWFQGEGTVDWSTTSCGMTTLEVPHLQIPVPSAYREKHFHFQENSMFITLILPPGVSNLTFEVSNWSNVRLLSQIKVKMCDRVKPKRVPIIARSPFQMLQIERPYARGLRCGRGIFVTWQHQGSNRSMNFNLNLNLKWNRFTRLGVKF